MNNLLIIGAALTASNFIYQAAAGNDWAQAFDRSVFQALALAVVALSQYMSGG